MTLYYYHIIFNVLAIVIVASYVALLTSYCVQTINESYIEGDVMIAK